MTLKAEFKELIRKLIALDMNVIVTARQKPQYADGAFMRVIGETFDGEKSLPYLFDTIVRLYRDEKGRFRGECLKDRSNKLPVGEFSCSIKMFEPLFGKVTLSHKAQVTGLITDDQKRQICELVACLGLSEQKVRDGLTAYDAENLDELTDKNARLIISKLEATAAIRSHTTGKPKED
jgi:hypothetical protein